MTSQYKLIITDLTKTRQFHNHVLQVGIKVCYFTFTWGCSSVGLWLVKPTAHRGERSHRQVVGSISPDILMPYFNGAVAQLGERSHRQVVGSISPDILMPYFNVALAQLGERA